MSSLGNRGTIGRSATWNIHASGQSPCFHEPISVRWRRVGLLLVGKPLLLKTSRRAPWLVASKGDSCPNLGSSHSIAQLITIYQSHKHSYFSSNPDAGNSPHHLNTAKTWSRACTYPDSRQTCRATIGWVNGDVASIMAVHQAAVTQAAIRAASLVCRGLIVLEPLSVAVADSIDNRSRQ